MMNANFKKRTSLIYLIAFTLACLVNLTTTKISVYANVNATLVTTSDFYEATTKTVAPTNSRFDKRKVKARLRVAFTYYTGYVDQIAALHKTALAIMAEYPKKETRIRNLTKMVAAENNYALRFHEDGETIIYRELTAKEVARELEKLAAVEEIFVQEVPEIKTVVKKPAKKQPKQDLQLKAFPNPTTEKLTIVFKGESTPTTVSIVDLSGKEIHQTVLPHFKGNHEETISLPKYVKGMVTVHITQEGQVVQQKVFVVQ